jgi:hypothetical protein
MIRLFFLLVFFSCTSALSAQVIINEISAANMTGITDSDGDREDWVELYNTGATAVNLSGWFLSDDPANPQKWKFPNGVTIGANGYRVIYCSGKDKLAGTSVHTNFKITQTQGETVTLSLPSTVVADTYTFTVPNQTDHSYGRIPVAGNTWKIFTTPTPNAANNTGSYTVYAPNVTTPLDPGIYAAPIQVALSTTPGYTIRYTTNGAEPTAASTLYTGPIAINTTTVLKARTFSANAQELPGFILYHTYFINVTHDLPIVSVSGNSVQTLLQGGGSAPAAAFEYFENGDRKADGYGEMNKHGNDSWAYQQRGFDWITRDQMGYEDELKEKFFPERERKRFQRLILKPAANDNYPFANGAHIRDAYVHTLALRGGMELDVRTSHPCVVYVNGQYWGLYEIREKVDDTDYTDFYYGQDELDVDFIKTWGATWNEYGTATDWNNLRTYILGNDMTIGANYAYVQQRLEMLSLIDYVIINQHTVCQDWLNWNTAWWRGRNPNGTAQKWRYTLWDMDATFGHYINYTGIPNTTATADPCDVEEIPASGDPQSHIDIFMKLYTNPQFKALYINRYADLMNTVLSCDYMNDLLDEMIGEIASEMPRQCQRWGGSVGVWNQKVGQLHSFIDSRCQFIDQSIENCYNVTGPYNLTVNVSPTGSANQVMVNSITPMVYPFNGEYFGGVNISLIPKPAPGWQFSHWIVNANPVPNTAPTISVNLQASLTVTAFFTTTNPCTSPTNLAVEGALLSPNINWTNQPDANSYTIRYREVGSPAWQTFNLTNSKWHLDTLPGCRNYEMQVQSVCPQGLSPFVDFNFNTPNHLQGAAVADAAICSATSAVLDATFPDAAYLWDNGSTAATRTVSTPGAYWVKYSLKGCTLTDTVQVAEINTTALIQQTLCSGETLALGSSLFDAQNPSGQVILPNMATSGCDSIINVSLSFIPPAIDYIAQTSCDPASVGVDTTILTSILGCDSLVITNTILTPASQTNLTATSCDPAQVGTDTLVWSNVYGCDSLVITTTTLAAFSQISLTATSCNPAQAGMDTLLLVNQLGCDSLVITTTTLVPLPPTLLSATSCDPAQVGNDTLVLNSVYGCDSLVITTTSLTPVPPAYLTAVSCNPAVVGNDTLVLNNIYGCDSLVITTTTFSTAGISTTFLTATACDPAAVGVDTLLLTNQAGCDSLVITTTSQAPIFITYVDGVTCNPALVGEDTLAFTSSYGCDSLIIVTLAFDASNIALTYLTAYSCDPAQIGTDTLYLSTTGGCDSLVITATALAPTNQTNLTATTCNPALAGIQTQVLSNQYGCDSLVVTTTVFDPALIPTTDVFVTSCDPAAVGINTLQLTGANGCDSIVVVHTSLVLSSKTYLSAVTCNPAQAGLDTLYLMNQYGCDSLVITITAFDPQSIPVTQLYVKNCDPAMVGTDTLYLNNAVGCDSLVITHTSLAPANQTLVAATSCDWAAVGTDTLLLSNVYGCDSMVITTVAYVGLALDPQAEDVRCFGERNGQLLIDTVYSTALPVLLTLDNRPAKSYNGTPIVWENLAPGTYTVHAVNAAGCSETLDIDIAEGHLLQIDPAQQTLQVHLGDSILVAPTADFQAASALWTPAAGVRCPTCVQTYMAPEKTGIYTLIASDEAGCTATASVAIQVDQLIRMYVPNAIAPGSGGPNADLTVFAGPEVSRILWLELYDRWGNKIFEKRDPAPNVPCGWDGTCRGAAVPPGVLIWVCKIETVDGREEVKRGDITVLR